MTATLPPHADVRDCRLYRFRVYHPDDMHLAPEQRRIVLGYVGETVRMPLARLLEHLYDQPWADTIVGWEVDPRIFVGKANVLEAERNAIGREQPLYNVEHNLGNPLRIPPPLAIRQRRARDAAARRARWVHPADRVGNTRVSTRPRARVVQRKRWRPWQKRLLACVIAWTVLTVAGWACLAYYRLVGGGQDQALTAAIGSLLLVAWVGRPNLKKRRRRR